MLARACNGGCGTIIPARDSMCDECIEERRQRRRTAPITKHHNSRAWRDISDHVRRIDGQCAICHRTEKLVVHHLRAYRNGGTDDINNLLTMCNSCHTRYETSIRNGKRNHIVRQVHTIAVERGVEL